MKFQTQFGDKTLEFQVTQDAGDLQILLDDQSLDIDFVKLTPNSYSLILDGHSHFMHITGDDNELEVTVDQQTETVTVLDETQILLQKIGFSNAAEEEAGIIHAPIPGLVTQIMVEVGAQINKGDIVCILEAMKMENEIFAPVSGIVKLILTEPGKALEKGDVIMEISDP